MSELYVRSVGLWSPGYANAPAWCTGDVDAAVEAPAANFLRGPLRRRATAQTRAAVEVLGQVVAEAGWDSSKIATIWGTAHGEHATSIAMFEWMARGEGRLSPTQFHNSVHNTAGGYASISQKNTTTSTTLTGAGELVVSGFVEALGLLRAGCEHVALVFFDEPLKVPFSVPGMDATLALGFGLTSQAEGSVAKLGVLQRESWKGVRPAVHFSGMHVAAALPLLEHVVSGRAGDVALQLETEASPVWQARIEPVNP